jgi:hypothetical protein
MAEADSKEAGMKVYIISQLRKDGTFPGLHKVASPSLMSRPSFPSPVFAGQLIEIWESREDAELALKEITERIGPFYAISELTLEVTTVGTITSL